MLIWECLGYRQHGVMPNNSYMHNDLPRGFWNFRVCRLRVLHTP